MVWRALLRIVDFQELLTSQAAIAESLETARQRHGPDSEEARTLREGFNLLAKILFTRRASIQNVHDLAWLDHFVVTKDARPSQIWEGDSSRTAWESLATNRGRLADLVPRRGSSWADVPIPGYGGPEPLKFERGVARPFRVGVVTNEGMLELMSDFVSMEATVTEGTEILHEVRRFAVEARHIGSESLGLVLAAASL
ncbi:MAG: hypothetical protein WC985_04595 [Thermoplasmata archaeon]